jgi:hypothetical protein
LNKAGGVEELTTKKAGKSNDVAVIDVEMSFME